MKTAEIHLQTLKKLKAIKKAYTAKNSSDSHHSSLRRYLPIIVTILLVLLLLGLFIGKRALHAGKVHEQHTTTIASIAVGAAAHDTMSWPIKKREYILEVYGKKITIFLSTPGSPESDCILTSSAVPKRRR